MSSRKDYKKSIFIPTNQHKYLGEKKSCVARSAWESSFMRYLDNSDNVVRWGSESISIPYRQPNSLRKRNYFVDFIVVLKNGRRLLIEIKPHAQTKPPVNSKNKKRSTMLYEEKMYKTNQAKWSAAQQYCESRGWEFRVITEKNFKF